ncbi:EVE domain-containing protein [Pinisolibacter aquiterrae]|jgi:predicted RNA-binding protein with PUA-like domain|uniref:EVE domain-containing protein n=1 Tax=Pinisolibacter aquiterrae TaxID=2815579 RepID=UPI001C3E076F|nr:EVE domain-containing protein [Pinisolibacter aquiterrae]MBV5266211.1 EVE domain-containing protein [Pinisolibacter aquiterrae]MCC8236299.1 EVE domain-containing protein [Pinisolibacter aquiterrae]
MAHWLYKSEPGVWSWDDQVAKGEAGTYWDGVRNPLANKNMKAMEVGERGFFYHSNEGKAVVGVVEVVATWAPDPNDAKGTYGAVTLKAVEKLPRPVTLAEIKADPRLAEMVLVKNSRLSVQPVTDEEWAMVRALGGLEP